MMIRYLDLSDEVDATIARYVITNPPNDFKMHPTDKVIIIINIIILKIIRIAMIIGTIYIMKFVITNFQPLWWGFNFEKFFEKNYWFQFPHFRFCFQVFVFIPYSD